MKAGWDSEASKLIVSCLREFFKDRLLAVVLFGSRARGDHRAHSDYDVFVLVNGYVSDPIGDYFEAYRALRPFRDNFMVDTTVVVISIKDLGRSISSPLLLNALVEGVPLYDRDCVMLKVRDKLLKKLESMGVERVKVDWGYSWHVPPLVKVPFRVEIDLDDPPSYG